MPYFPYDPCHLPASLDPNVDPAIRREYRHLETRRQFFGRAARGLGGAALAALGGNSLWGALASSGGLLPVGASQLPNLAPKAKRAIYLVMHGAPSQLDTFDYKPHLAARSTRTCPNRSGAGQALTGMSSGQARLPIAPTIYPFRQYGQAGTWVSDPLPWTAKLVDEIAVIKTVNTDAINHDPAITFLLTGNTVPGKPSMGSWISYGLGSYNENLPTFVVLTSRYPAKVKPDVQAMFARLWGSGFLPASYAGVSLRSNGEPVLFLKDPQGVSREARRVMLEGVQKLNAATYEDVGDPETHARIEEYEMAFRMQTSWVPELTDMSGEPAETFALYGPDSRVPGSFAYNCLLARRMAERGVRFSQIFHRGWDSHHALPSMHPVLCRDMDRACYALVTDLKRRGLLDDTLVVWGGEFGRTVYCQGTLTKTDYGRDHHPKCYTMWMAGGGVRPGLVYGETDDYSYNIARDPVHVRDLNATILHLLGIDHDRLTFKFQGLEQKLTGTIPAKVVEGLLA